MSKKILKPMFSLANPGAMLGISKDPVVEVLYGAKGKPVPNVLPMPLADDDAVKMARKRSISAQRSRGGRTSTFLTGDGDTLG